MTSDPKIIIALDFPAVQLALDFIAPLSPKDCRLKVGKELFTIGGSDFVKILTKKGFDVFLDLKFHDIPNTVAAACHAAADLGVWMINVHASGGRKMMETAANRLAQLNQPPLLIGVTILTSLSADEIHEIGFSGSPAENVLRLAKLADDSGLNGVVCSPLEAATVRQATHSHFKLITPGVRPKSAAMDDQTRVMTPADALQAGANYLVIGRPITAAKQPLEALNAIIAETL